METHGEGVARAVHERLRAIRSDLLFDLRRIVEQESPSGDTVLLASTAEWLAAWFATLGRVEKVTTELGTAPHLLVECGRVEDGKTPFVLCHYDTVWPGGTIKRWPFTVTGDSAHGPGVLDMKGSIVLVRHALDALRQARIELPNGVRLLLSADEEIGNPTSRGLIAELAARSKVALVMEPPLEGGGLKTERKGHALVHLEVQGRSAHAGIEPEQGINAAVEAAHFVVCAHELNDCEKGTSVNVGKLSAGQAANVVAPHAELELDVRAVTDDNLERTLDTLRGLRPKLPGSSLRYRVVRRRPAMPRTPQTDLLVASARRVGGALGMVLAEGPTGGVSEGNLTQAEGTPTLDGLGVEGSGAHTPEEQIRISSLPRRAGLYAGLLVDLSTATPAR